MKELQTFRKYLAEGRLFEENNDKNAIDWLRYSLDVYLEGDMGGTAPNYFTLEKEEYTPEYQGEEEAESFNQAVDYLQKNGDVQFSSDYGYIAVASLKDGDIHIRFKEEPQF